MLSARPPRRAALIVNVHSRKGRKELAAARRLLRECGVQLTIVRGIDRPKALGEAVGAAIRSGVPMVIVGGGDGTLLACVDRFVGTKTVLGVLPLGTANSFARALRLPLDLEGAVAVIAAGHARCVDLGEIDGKIYAGCASMGLAPQIAESVPRGLKAWAGRPGYMIWAAGQLARFKPFRICVTVGGQRHEMKGVEVRIANGPFHGGVELVDSATLDSGQIVVQVVTGERRRDLLLNWAAHLVGSNVRWRQVRQFEAATLTLSTHPALPISIDGEVLAKTPVTIRARPRALMVVAPVSDDRGR